MYIYPHTGTDWVAGWKSLWAHARRLSAAGARTLVVINPSNGPGATADIAYTRAIDRSMGSGCRCIGYVATGYGARTLGQITADIDLWGALYPTIDGFFFDEVSTALTDLPVLQLAVDYARRRWPVAPVVGNAGTSVDKAIQSAFDLIITSEIADYPAEPTDDYQDSPIERPRNRAAVSYAVSSLDANRLRSMAGWYPYIWVSRSNSYAVWDEGAMAFQTDAIIDALRVPTPAVLRTLADGYALHAWNNPRLNGIYPRPALITVGAAGGAVPSGFTRAYVFGDLGAPFTSGGGNPVTVSGATSFPVVTPSGTAQVGRHWRVTTVLDGTQLAFHLDSDGTTNGGYRFLVDGQYVSMKGTISGAGTERWYTLRFAGRAKRVITVEGYGALRFWGAAVPDTDTLLMPQRSGPRIVLLGDSDLEAYGVVLKGDGPAAVYSDFFGVQDVWAQGVYGTGFLATNWNTSYSYSQRRGDWLTAAPDAFVFGCSINDLREGYSAVQIATAAVAEVQAVRAALGPSVPVFVMGYLTDLEVAEAALAGATAAMVASENALADAFVLLGDPYAAFIRIVSAAVPQAVVGAGTGNSPLYIDGGTGHATPAGYIAGGVANSARIAEVCAAMGGLEPRLPSPPLPVDALQTAYPKRLSTPKIAGDLGGTALTTAALTAARQIFIPVVVPRAVALSGLRISVTTAAAGTASVGVYDSTVDASGNDTPGSLLAGATGLDTGATGDKTGTFATPLLLEPGTLYWVSLIASAAPTVRALAAGAIQSVLGRTVNNTTVIGYLFVAGSGSTLPATASQSLTAGVPNVAAIYLIEQ